ncbi:hypothetical protein PFISCL1PPCAC_8477, partial [Pristionchus fissidentatus]
PTWTVPLCFASLIALCVLTGIFLEISMWPAVPLLFGVVLLVIFISTLFIKLSIDGEITKRQFAIVSFLSVTFAVASIISNFYFPIFVGTLNLIILSFAAPHLCMFIRISHKFNHRLIAAFCIPLI